PDGLSIIFSIFCRLFSLALCQLLGTLPLCYKDVYRLDSTQIGLLLGFSGFVIVVFEMVLVHFVEHRFTVRQIMVWGTAITSIAYFMLNIDFGLIWLYRSEEHTSELQSRENLVCRLLLE